MKKVLSLLLSAALCLTVFASCGAKEAPESSAESSAESSVESSAESSEETAGGHVELLRIGTTASNDNFNATSQSGILGKINYTGFCQGNMFVNDEEGNLIPSMLESYEISGDNKVLTMVIPTGVLWHDNVPMTIDDLLFTFEYNRDVIHSGSYQHFENLEVIGDNTLKITFDEELTAFNFINNIGNMSKIYPRHIWEKVADPKEYMGDDRNVGCGPYKLTELDADAQVSYYEAMPDYWKGELTVDKVSIKTYASQEALVMAMANDEIDAMYDYSKPVSTTLYDTVEKYEALDLGLAQDPGVKMLMMGYRKAPTDDLAFRQAISYAIDYNMLALTVGGKYATVGNAGLIPSSNVSYYKEGLPQMTTDYEKAAEMLDAAGYADADGDGWRDLKDGSVMELLIVPQNNKSQQELMLRINSILADSLEKVQVKTVFSEECLTSREAWSQIAEQEGAYNIHLGYCTSGMAAYIGGAACYLVDSSINHWWGTCDTPAFVDNYNALATIKNFDEYREIMLNLQQIIADDVVAIPTCWETAAFPHRTDRYTGWSDKPGEGVINYRVWYNLRTK